MLNAGVVASDNRAEGRNIACILDFEMKEGEELIVRTGISAVDEAAAGNLAAEIPGWDSTVWLQLHSRHGRRGLQLSMPCHLTAH